METETQIAILNEKITEEVQEATENYRIVLDKYNNGLSNTNDLLEANVEQLQAKINYTVSTSDILQKYYELQFQKGKLTQSIN